MLQNNNNTKRIYLSPPHMTGKEIDYINNAFKENWIAPVGPNIEAFEKELAEYLGVAGAVALTSGTAAIHIALRLLGVKESDYVFCSSLTFVASANPITYLGASPVFIDSDDATWNMSPVALEEAMEDAKRRNCLPRAVVVVNLYGQNPNMTAIEKICNKYEVPIVEDAAESLGATYRCKKSGTFGKFGVFSFNGNKIITTSGGGALISNDKKSLEIAKYLSTQAKDPFKKYYHHSEVGYNYRLSNLLAGVGRAQLKVISQRVEARRKVFKRYYRFLSTIAGVDFMPEVQEGYSNRWLTAITLDPTKIKVSPDQLINKLEEYNIESRNIWKPLHMQPIFQGCKFYSHKMGESVAERLFKTGVCLPSGSNLSKEEQDIVIEKIKDIIVS